MAVTSLETVVGVEEAIPALEALLIEPEAKCWIKFHVSRVIEALQENVEKKQ